MFSFVCVRVALLMAYSLGVRDSMLSSITLYTHLMRASAGLDAPTRLDINQRREHEASVESLKACVFSPVG